MTTARSIVCGSCGSDVPYGRLSCPACGDLLASVAGGTRRATSSGDGLAAMFDPPSKGATTSAAPAPERVAPSILHDAAEPDRAGPTLHASSATLAFDDEPLAAYAADAAEDDPADDDPAETWDAPVEPSAAPDAAAVSLAADPDDDLVEPAEVQASAPVAAGLPAATEDWAPATSVEVDEPLAAYAPPPIVDGSPTQAPAYSPPPPGAYVPPVATAAGGGAAAYAMAGGPAAPARTWAGHGAADLAGAAILAGADGQAPGTSSSVAGVDAARLAEFVGWLAIAGGALAAVGFLLPWGASIIGSTGVGYLDRWGLAGPFHLVVALAVVALVVSIIVPNRVPAWVRIGLGGTILGVFMLGLVWPYVFGFSSTGPGALAVALGATALVVAGVTCLVADRRPRADRHAPSAPPV